MLTKIRYVIWVLIALLGATILFFQQGNNIKDLTGQTTGIGGEFELIDTNGAPFTQEDLKGTNTALFFGFTNCPDVCPTTMFELANASQSLTDVQKQNLKIVFVSVDHERDTPQFLSDYLGAFQSELKVIGLSGSKEQVAKAAKAYRVYYQKVGEDENFTYDHTASTFLLDQDGVFQGTLSYGETPSVIVEKLKRLADS